MVVRIREEVAVVDGEKSPELVVLVLTVVALAVVVVVVTQALQHVLF